MCMGLYVCVCVCVCVCVRACVQTIAPLVHAVLILCVQARQLKGMQGRLQHRRTHSSLFSLYFLHPPTRPILPHTQSYFWTEPLEKKVGNREREVHTKELDRYRER